MRDRLEIRQATVEDAATIAAFHLAVWRVTYRTLATPEAFAALDGPSRLKRWTAFLARPEPDDATTLAFIDGVLAGFVMSCAPADPSFGGRGQIRYLYVDPARHGRGLGTRLIGLGAERLAARGYGGVALGVVVGNAPAIAFYEARGGRCVGRYTDPGPIWRSDNLVYAWDDPTMLTIHARP